MKDRNSNQGDEVEKMEDSIFVGFFVIAGYCDKHGKFVEDDKSPVNLKN